MSDALRFETWDVFTDRRFAGNQLAVVFGADALSTEAMQAIAREFNYSESVEMGRPSRIRVRFELREGGFGSLRVGGHAIAVSSGEFRWRP